MVAAFGLVRAAAAADLLVQSSPDSPLSIDAVIGPAALYAAQSMLVFGFAAAALEAGFQMGWLKRFPGSATDPRD